MLLIPFVPFCDALYYYSTNPMIELNGMLHEAERKRRGRMFKKRGICAEESKNHMIKQLPCSLQKQRRVVPCESYSPLFLRTKTKDRLLQQTQTTLVQMVSS